MVNKFRQDTILAANHVATTAVIAFITVDNIMQLWLFICRKQLAYLMCL